MATAEQVIKAALQEILVQASESPIQASEAQDALFYLNNMMAALAVDGISLGYTTLANLGDDLTVSDGAIEGIIANLAIRLHAQFTAMATVVKPDLAVRADNGLNTMRNIAFTGIGPSSFPSTLPIGSGNEDDTFGGCQRHFFPGESEAVLSEQGGFIALEDETEVI